MTIPTKLIENALALCGKNHEEFFEEFYCGIFYDRPDIRKSFSIEKFCFYLLSPEFIEKYKKEYEFALMDDGFELQYYLHLFSEAISAYQRKDKEFPE